MSGLTHIETYLLEARWQNEWTGASDLHTFKGKLGEKARSTGVWEKNGLRDDYCDYLPANISLRSLGQL